MTHFKALVLTLITIFIMSTAFAIHTSAQDNNENNIVIKYNTIEYRCINSEADTWIRYYDADIMKTIYTNKLIISDTGVMTTKTTTTPLHPGEHYKIITAEIINNELNKKSHVASDLQPINTNTNDIIKTMDAKIETELKLMELTDYTSMSSALDNLISALYPLLIISILLFSACELAANTKPVTSSKLKDDNDDQDDNNKKS